VSVDVLRSAGTARPITIPEGPAGRRLLVLLICSSSLFITYLDRDVISANMIALQ
jgi:hypothetical protein